MAAAFGVEIAVLDHLEPHRLGERIGASAGKHDMFRLVHDRPRRKDRVLHALDPRHRSSIAVRAAHDRRIQLMFGGRGEHSAVAGIEQRVVFHRDHGRLHRIDG